MLAEAVAVAKALTLAQEVLVVELLELLTLLVLQMPLVTLVVAVAVAAAEGRAHPVVVTAALAS
jgi:hypothetical protein